ncbi:hypothetical protein E2P71_10980, partial [Candidatus Bathyarchaeota archaeon]
MDRNYISYVSSHPTKKLKGEERLTNSKSKATTIAAALLIILAMAISLLASPANNEYAAAQTTTYAYIGAVPNPVGVNQEVLLHIGITQQLNSAEQGWDGLTVT